MLNKSILTAVLIAAVSVPAMAQDAQKGKTVFNVCLACHTIGPGAQISGHWNSAAECPLCAKMYGPAVRSKMKIEDRRT